MKFLTMTQRDRRALLVGTGLITAILVADRGIPRISRWNERLLVQAAHDLRRVRTLEPIAMAREGMLDSLHSYRAVLDTLDARAFAAPTPAMAGVDLAGLLERLATQQRIAVSSTVVLADSAFRTPRAAISVRLFAVADSRGLYALLRALESSQLGLEVTELVISQPEPAADAYEIESLRVELVVRALARATRGLERG